MSQFNCEDVESRLQEFVDGFLTPPEERRMREHLATCDSCRHDERDLRRLLTRVAELPREVTPERELWAGIAARLGEQQDAADEAPAAETPRRLLAGPWRGYRPRDWAWQAAAALVFMAMGALLTFLATSSPENGTDVVARAAGDGDIRNASAAATKVSFLAAETDYLRAKEALWMLVAARRDQLSPIKLVTIERNLLIIDEATRDLHEALREDPGNPRLEALVLANHRRGIDLLQRLSEPDLSTRSRRSGSGARI